MGKATFASSAVFIHMNMEEDFEFVLSDDTDIVINEKRECKQWEILMEQIYRRNVIPVIGPRWNGPDSRTVPEAIIRAVESKCGIPKGECKSFSKLISHTMYLSHYKGQDDIYNLIYEILRNNKLPLNESLKKFLSLPYFPFVISTSFDPAVENVMRSIHGNDLKVLTFDNNAMTNDDIDLMDNDLKKPTVYYIFGKANGENKKFVATDYDLLAFSRTWLAKTDFSSNEKPPKLASALSKKYLLVMGCDYQSWLFRFFWYAMKDGEVFFNPHSAQHEKCNTSESLIPLGMFAETGPDEELITFLTDSNTFTKDMTAVNLAEEIERRMVYYETMHHPSPFDTPEEGCDVFISYSRADKAIAEQLYAKLVSKGLKVWYDKNNLMAGDDFKKSIRKAIRTARLFVPVLTPSIHKQYREEHVYRQEWDWAVESYVKRGNVKFLIPFCEDGFNINDDKSGIPEQICAHHVFCYNPLQTDASIEQFTTVIKNMLDEECNG